MPVGAHLETVPGTKTTRRAAAKKRAIPILFHSLAWRAEDEGSQVPRMAHPIAVSHIPYEMTKMRLVRSARGGSKASTALKANIPATRKIRLAKKNRLDE